MNKISGANSPNNPAASESDKEDKKKADGDADNGNGKMEWAHANSDYMPNDELD